MSQLNQHPAGQAPAPMPHIKVDLSSIEPGLVRYHKERGMFSTFDCTSMRDPRLSNKAVGLHMRLRDNVDYWQVREGPLAKKGKDKRYTIRSQLHELEDCGYLVRIEVRNERNQFQGIVSYVFDRPVDPAHLILPPNCKTLLGKRRAKLSADDIDPNPPAVEASADEDALEGEPRFFWPSGFRFSDFGLSVFGKPQHSNYFNFSHYQKSQLVKLKGVQGEHERTLPSGSDHTPPAGAGGADAPGQAGPSPSPVEPTTPVQGTSSGTDKENLPGAGAADEVVAAPRQTTEERLLVALGVKTVENGLKAPVLPDLLKEQPGGLDRHQWLKLPLDEVNQLVDDAFIEGRIGKGKFRTLLIKKLDAAVLKRLNAMKPAPVKAEEEPAGPVMATPAEGQVWRSKRTEEHVIIARVQVVKGTERRRGVTVEVERGTFIHLTTGRKFSLGEFMLGHSFVRAAT